jgi:GNAT superfamily N-acetyltransferase
LAVAETLVIGSLSPAAADDALLMSTIADLVNEVYAVGEEGLWADGAFRTNADEVAALTRAGQIAVARSDGQIVGCVRIQRLDEHVCEFGMLAAAPTHRGIGVGRELVRFAEQQARDAGHGTMQLELLVPRTWTHPSKERLAGWYSRIGYRTIRTGTIDDAYPHLAPLLATTCDFVIYQKALRA